MVECRLVNLRVSDRVILPPGGSVGVHVTGHAGWGARGDDIVCAAASVLVHTLVVAAHRQGRLLEELKEDNGLMRAVFRCPPEGDPARERLGSFLEFYHTGMRELSDRYPEHIRLLYDSEITA